MVGWSSLHSWPTEHQDIQQGPQDGMGFEGGSGCLLKHLAGRDLGLMG